MAVISQGWQFQVERGPDWLFIRPTAPEDETLSGDLAAQIWDLCRQHFTYRLVLEMQEVGFLSSIVIGQFITLVKRITEQGGVLRLCGLNDQQAESLRLCRLEHTLPSFESRVEAVQGSSVRRAK